jgi:hypothetical protein
VAVAKDLSSNEGTQKVLSESTYILGFCYFVGDKLSRSMAAAASIRNGFCIMVGAAAVKIGLGGICGERPARNYAATS